MAQAPTGSIWTDAIFATPPWYNIIHVDGSTLTSSVVVLLVIFGRENVAEFRQHVGCFGEVFGVGLRH